MYALRSYFFSRVFFSYTCEFSHSIIAQRVEFTGPFILCTWVYTFVYFRLNLIGLKNSSHSQSDLCGRTSSTEVIVHINPHRMQQSNYGLSLPAIQQIYQTFGLCFFFSHHESEQTHIRTFIILINVRACLISRKIQGCISRVFTFVIPGESFPQVGLISRFEFAIALISQTPHSRTQFY